MMKFDSLPQLAVGSHPRDSHKACIMNALSYLNGDTEITDTPSCVWVPLAHLVQMVNDTCCGLEHHRPGAKPVVRVPSPGMLLCPSCTHKMWMIGARIIGTTEAERLPDGMRLAAVKAMAQLAVKDLGDRGGCRMMIEAFEDALADDISADDLLSLRQRCQAEHVCHNSPLGEQLTGVMFSIFDYLRDETPEAKATNLMGVCRVVLAECDDIFVLLGQMLDAFEVCTGLQAVPPTPEEINRAAQRAGLALV